MLEVDLHVHTFYSNCGVHSHLEMLTRARDMGMKAVAITDHGPELGGRSSRIVFDRLFDPIDGIRFLKGMECNFLPDNRTIDLPMELLHYLDVVIVGVHPTTPLDLGKKAYTAMLLHTIETYPCIDIIAHPNDVNYPVDFTRVAEAARVKGIALELNNSKTLLQRSPDELTLRLIEACRDTGCPMAVCSDAHAINELGRDEEVAPLLERAGYPRDMLVTRDGASALEFVERRRPGKRAVAG